MSGHLVFGQQGEDLAASYLAGKGLALIDRNVRTPYGEIDLILLDGDVVVFTEVKARSTRSYGGPWAAVGREKRRRISRAAQAFLIKKGWQDRAARFDVVAIVMEDSKPSLDHLVDAFDLVMD
ncbi:MAG: YraN family protein [Deltaproteobacteria bacterium]|nr:YraN family protein [Deltaproteobacteria bacterium]MBW2052716.1 YraN family protein [Deltaproteobacteria bacterium]